MQTAGDVRRTAKKLKRTFAYRNGKAVEITGENIILGRGRYPLIKMSDKDWNKPR